MSLRREKPEPKPLGMAGSTLLLLFAALDPGGMVGVDIDPL